MQSFSKIIFALLFLFFPISFVKAQVDASPASTDRIFDRNGIPNFSSFGPGMYRGGRPRGHGFQTVQDLGVKTVINLQGGNLKNSRFAWIEGVLQKGETPEWISYEKQKFESMGIRTVNLPMNSLDPVDSKEQDNLREAMKIIADPSQHPIFVHCEHGRDRTGLLIALYRVLYQQWPRSAAHDEMVQSGHGLINQILTKDLDRYFWEATKGHALIF